MVTITLTRAKARLSELLDKMETGEDIIITRHGHPVARLTLVSPPKMPVRSLARFRAKMPGWRRPSVELLRETRDEGP